MRYLDARGEPRPYLDAAEVAALQVRRGSLTDAERVEIESHVVHTYNFLEQIPWGRQLARRSRRSPARTTRSSTAPAIRAGSRATRFPSSRA